jgi:NitT/TauT family transport system ATP-binding protein
LARDFIEIQNLYKVYPARSGEVVHALEDVSFSVRNQEFLTIVGRSGCGKTTILKILAGLLLKTSGSVRVQGAEVDGPRPDVGIVFQAPTLPPWRTVLRNVELPIEILGLDVGVHKHRAMELLRFVGLEGFEYRYPRELSGGMQQRVSICRALIHDPPLLLMDEPFGALDALTREEMNLELLRIWQEQKKTSVLITHSIEEAIFLSDRIVVMTPRPGRVERIVEVVLPRPRTPEMRHMPEFHALRHEIEVALGLLK